MQRPDCGPRFLQPQVFALPDKGGDGEISFPGNDFWAPGNYLQGGVICALLSGPMGRGEKGRCHAPVEDGEKSLREAVLCVIHFFPPDEKVGLRFVLNRAYHAR
jgi:hypothetical protein